MFILFFAANTSQYAHYVFNTLDQDHSGLLSFEVSSHITYVLFPFSEISYLSDYYRFCTFDLAWFCIAKHRFSLVAAYFAFFFVSLSLFAFSTYKITSDLVLYI